MLRRIPPHPWAHANAQERQWEEDYTELYNSYSSTWAQDAQRITLERLIATHPYVLARTQSFRTVARYEYHGTGAEAPVRTYFEDITGDASVRASAWPKRGADVVIKRDTDARYNHEAGILYDVATATTIYVFAAGTAPNARDIASVEHWIIFV